jgi:plastocyanin
MRMLRALALLAVAGCGSGSGTATTSSVPPTPTPTPTPNTVTVEVGTSGSFSFSPQTVNINPGDTVMWQWAPGSIAHTVTSGAPGAVDGKFCSLPAGTAPSASACDSISYAQSTGSYSYTFPTAGNFPYFCEVHGAMMTGMVVVGSGSGGGSGGGGGGGGGSGGGGPY